MGAANKSFDIIFYKKVKALQSIPGPAPALPWGNADAFLKEPNPWIVCQQIAKKYGDYALIWLVNTPAVLLHNTKLIEKVLVTDWDYFYKEEPCEALRPVVTTSNPFIANGADWTRKKNESPLFQSRFSDWLLEQVEPLTKVISEGTSLLDSTENLESNIQRLLFDGFAVLTVGTPFSNSIYRSFMNVMKVGDIRMKTNLPYYSPSFFFSRRRWFSVFNKFLDRSKDGAYGKSLLPTMLRGNRLTYEFYRNEMANIFPGGLFSTSSALVNALKLIANHSETYTRLRTEILKIRSDFACPTYSQIRGCQTLEAVLRETMRLYPPAPVLSRAVGPNGYQLGEFHLPHKTRILMSHLPIHLNAEVWPEPETFLPTRWNPKTLAKHPYGSEYFFPFGRGPRTCVGQEFALFVLRVSLFTLISEWDLKIDPHSNELTYFFGCLMPKNVKATLSPRT